ncbi:MAG TPA: cation:proton antiporter [Actinobacteria bacterium]|nr:cation:proton antiporter [Actinomycetota bacterium]
MNVVVAAEVADVLPGGATFIAIGLGAFLLPVVARRIGVPSVVLEILFGVLIGPAFFGLIGVASTAEGFLLVLAELGLFLLLFLAGFEIDFDKLEREGPVPILWGLGYYVAALVVAWFGFGLVGVGDFSSRLFMTFLVSAASLGIVVPALRATNTVNTRLGQVAIVTGVLAEFLSATALVVYGVVVETGLTYRLLAIPGFVVVALVVLAGMRRVAWWYPEYAERLFTAHDPDEMGIRASLALLFVFVGLSLALGIDPILGAFVAGAAFTFVFRHKGDLETRLTGFAYGFFIPIFFIGVGVRFPVDELRSPAALVGAATIIVVAIGSKLVPAPLFLLRGLGLSQAMGVGVLLAGQLSVVIALAEFGVQIGVIDDRLAAGATLLVAVTAIGSPILFRLLVPGERRDVGVDAEDRA